MHTHLSFEYIYYTYMYEKQILDPFVNKIGVFLFHNYNKADILSNCVEHNRRRQWMKQLAAGKTTVPVLNI